MPFPNEIAEINLSSGQDGGQEISKIAILDEPKRYLACPARFERATYALEGRCSIQLSYRQITEFKQLFQNLDFQRGYKASRSSGDLNE